MILDTQISCQKIHILAPRWHDRVILIAKYKVGQHNEITFKAKQYPGIYYLSGETIKGYPLESNGTIPCYAVSLDEIETLERRDIRTSK